MTNRMESFIEVPSDSDFPLENLPWGVFEVPGAGPQVHVGVALGDHVISATELHVSYRQLRITLALQLSYTPPSVQPIPILRG